MMARHRPHRLDEPTGPELDRLRKAYLDRSITVLELQRRFRLSDYRITALAVREGWPLRRTVRATTTTVATMEASS